MAARSKPPISPRLVVIEGPEKGRIVPLRPGTLVIGRSKGDVIIQDPRISRSHVAIHVDESSGKVTFTDLKSLNGVQHNGDNLEAGELKDGDRLQLGNTTFDCQTGLQEESSTEPAIAIKKRREDAKGFEETQVSSVDVLADLKPEPTAFGEPVFAVEPPAPEGKVLHFYRGLSKRTKVCAGAVVGLLVVFIFLPSAKPTRPVEDGAGREFASIRKLEQEGKLTEAAAKAEKVKADSPTNPTVHRILGELYQKQRAWDLAIQSYKRSFDLDPKQIELLPQLARLYLTTNNVEAAQSINAEIDLYMTKGPLTKEFFLSVANLYLDFPNLELRPEKMVIIGQAMQNKFAPDDSAGYKLEALGHIEQGHPEDGLKVLDKARTQFPSEEGIFTYIVLGKMKLKDYDGATNSITQWMGLFPQSLQPLILMAQMKYQYKEYDESLSYLQKAVQIGGAEQKDPKYPEAVYLLGDLYYQQNQTIEAENALRKSCELGFTEGCEHVLIKGTAGRSPQSIKKK